MISPHPAVDVAVAILRREDGRVLLAQRPVGKPWAGYWEFPGGKIEPGEDPRRALTRELHEELGVDTGEMHPWLTQEYAYPQKNVRLHFYRILSWRGEPHGREGQEVSWEEPAAIRIKPLLPANDKALRALCLPLVYAITNLKKYGEAEFLRRLEAALEKGVRLIQVREPDMAPEKLEPFARNVVAMAHRRGARVLINRDTALALRCGADGVHLNSEQLMSASSRPQVPLCAVSCHDAVELAHAAKLEADFAVLSPVLPTATHPEASGLGWTRFAELVKNSPVPIYALGGMKTELLDTAMRHGAHGISLLSGIW